MKSTYCISSIVKKRHSSSTKTCVHLHNAKKATLLEISIRFHQKYLSNRMPFNLPSYAYANTCTNQFTVYISTLLSTVTVNHQSHRKGILARRRRVCISIRFHKKYMSNRMPFDLLSYAYANTCANQFTSDISIFLSTVYHPSPRTGILNSMPQCTSP